MPKETFTNLNKQKKEKILQVAIDEFAEHSFQLASINRIVEKAGIAKGSFYQYFEDKKDLYQLVLDRIVEEKLQYITPAMRNPEGLDFYMLLKEVYLSAILFAAEHPKYAKIGYYMIFDDKSDVYKELLKDNMDKSLQMYEMMIENSKKQGGVREDMDTKLCAYFAYQMGVNLAKDFYLFLEEQSRGHLEQLVDNMIDLMKNGMGKGGNE
ncbi:MAG TPA: TetR/AcrR family transcriptional regulator [Eubacteriaceae bacterium]|nr:TetR/AcrR family transcriptional regulator [Eubacteriaceae bacterium]